MPWRRNPILTGAGLIAAERQRQIDVEGWTPEHDAEHGPRQGARGAPLVRAAIAYLDRNVAWWPWGREYWKPARTDSVGDRVRELVKAGALIAAEIDRLQSAAVGGAR